MVVLGLHGGVTIGQHEPSATLVVDGNVIAMCEEERYLRIKSSYGYLPYYSIKACLKIGSLSPADIDLVVCPGITYDDFRKRIADYLRHAFGISPRIELVHHQDAHLAAAFYGSGFDEALCLSLDATGDGSSGSIALGSRTSGLKTLGQIPTQESLGFFYTMMTHYLGFDDGDEYKVMGLAPYGKPVLDLGPIISPTDDGWSFDWSYIRSTPPCKSPFEPRYSPKLADLLRHPSRCPGEPLSDFHRDVACSTQKQMEECFLSFTRHFQRQHPQVRNFCYAGGVALNCVANGRLFYSGLFDQLYVPPVSSDRGLSLGCAYLGTAMEGMAPTALGTPYLGSQYTNEQVLTEIKANGLRFSHIDDPSSVASHLLADHKIIGWFQGRSEAGARALGNRSILASAADEEMRDQVNKKIKYREEFRPFAPSVLDDERKVFFRMGASSPHMCFTFEAVPSKVEKMRAVVHVDGTSRVQTVSQSDNPRYYDLLKAYHSLTGIPVILNTSFNLKGQAIVESPRDALMTFFGCGLDALIIGNFLLLKPT